MSRVGIILRFPACDPSGREKAKNNWRSGARDTPTSSLMGYSDSIMDEKLIYQMYFVKFCLYKIVVIS